MSGSAAGGGDDDDWCLIESDPGVFTEMLEEIGCTNVQLEELWSLDDETLLSLENSGCIYGLIFLFQWEKPETKGGGGGGGSSAPSVPNKKVCLPEDQIPEGLFFAHQVTTNACATQAILSVVLNSTSSSSPVELGTTLSEFRDFTASFPPSLKGVAISGSEPIKKAHNQFGRTDAFLNDGKHISPLRQSDDVFHFVAYIPKHGTVYELDGLQQGPIIVGEYKEEEEEDSAAAAEESSSKKKPELSSWLSVARTAIQERMTANTDVIKFNLMAVIEDKRIGLQRKLLDDDPNSNLLLSVDDKESIQIQIQMEEQKRNQWKLENQRRRHNYVPLCVTILKELAKTGKLPEYVDKAKERKKQQLEAAAAKKMKS